MRVGPSLVGLPYSVVAANTPVIASHSLGRVEEGDVCLCRTTSGRAAA